MLEQAYWIAGIVLTAATVVGLFLHFKPNSSAESRQNAEVSGERNSVNQSSDIRNGETKGP